MQTIEAKYLPATNTKPSRIKAIVSSRGFDGKRPSVTISHDGDENGFAKAALILARKLGWHGTLIQGGTETGAVFVFANDQRHEI